MRNIEFTYLYRDGNNFKKWGSVIFSNLERLPIDAIDKQMRPLLLIDLQFMAGQVRVPELFLYDDGPFSYDDHCYHEFKAVHLTTEVANDIQNRSIGEFLVEFARESENGWREFDPYNSEGSLGDFLAARPL